MNAPASPVPMDDALNLVICLDGTGNQFNEDNTNVVKAYRCLVREPRRQIAYWKRATPASIRSYLTPACARCA